MADCVLYNDTTLSTLMQKNAKPVLVLRVKESNCHTCVDNELALLENVFNEMDSRVMILASWSSYSQKTYKMRAKKFYFFNIPPTLLDELQIEEEEIPYYFVLHPNMRISNLFLPNKALNEKTEQYLSDIKKLLSE